jgi:hypothetical protein
MVTVNTHGIALEMACLGRDERLSPEHLLHRLTTLTARLVPGCCGASVTVWSAGRMQRSSVSHADLAALRDLPRASSQDPERQALARQQAVSIPDTRMSAGWGHFAACAAAFGIRSVVFEPAGAGPADATFGFYATEPYAFDGSELAFIARQAGAALQEADYHDELMRGVYAVRAGLETRSVIDQATGIIMAERSCSAEAAFAELRMRSNHGNLKLAEVARNLVREAESARSSG